MKIRYLVTLHVTYGVSLITFNTDKFCFYFNIFIPVVDQLVFAIIDGRLSFDLRARCDLFTFVTSKALTSGIHMYIR